MITESDESDNDAGLQTLNPQAETLLAVCSNETGWTATWQHYDHLTTVQGKTDGASLRHVCYSLVHSTRTTGLLARPSQTRSRCLTPHAVGRFVMSIFPSFSEEMVHMMRPPHRPIDFIAEHSRRRRWVLRIGARTYRITRTVWIRLIIQARHWF